MKTSRRQSGFTLTEMMVVVAIIALFVTMAMPAFTKMMQSNKTGESKTLIKSFFAVAQARAAMTQNYVGVRFQFDKTGWKNGRQYMILIEKGKPRLGYSPSGTEYNAVPNTKPAALPAGVCVISGAVPYTTPAIANGALDDEKGNRSVTTQYGMDDMVTFSVIFTPTGQMVVKDVMVLEQPTAPANPDPIFGSRAAVDKILVMPIPPQFYHDRSWGAGTGIGQTWCYQEPSATGFYIAEVEGLKDCLMGKRWELYVGGLEPCMINMYTGEVFEQKDYK